MAVQVETFEVIESTFDDVENRSECLSIIEGSGLEGQKSLLSGDTEQVCPYRKMTKEELFVYETILSEKTDIKKFAEGPIPLRVLQVYSHAGSLQFFTSFSVWHCPNADIKDPILVGERQIGEYSWNKERYILARWGEVLEPFQELVKIAAKIARDKFKAQCIEVRQMVENKLAVIDSIPDSAIVNGSFSVSASFSA